ncbi:S1 family peptidase [Streptosporangium sp. NPDC050855]|uniref:S1 family peptidase n=1 Tax=Streptosporangium sp. NPDC050855 TaxID=3366194 RepID=UPI0037A192DD
MVRRPVLAAGCVPVIVALALGAVPARADRPGGVVLAPAAAPAAAAVSAVKPPPGMLEAIEQDLNMSREEAETRLINENRLLAVAARLRERLGVRFGGAWLRTKTAHTLVVATTSAADIPQIIVEGAQAEVVPRSLAQLVAIRKKLDAALPPDPLISSVRYVDVKRNKVIVLAPTPQRVEIFVQKAGVNRAAVTVLPSVEVPLPLSAPAYELVGGAAYYVGPVNRCSVGFSVLKGTRPGFVSAGHCGRQGDVTTGFNRVAQGVFQASTFPGSDHAWITVNESWRTIPAVDSGAGSTVPVSGARPAVEGASVCQSGSTTDWQCGRLQQLSASVTYPGGVVSELTRTSICAEPGDSGGPIISIDQAQGVTSGGSGDCASGGTTYFQPIAAILTAYGLTLKTTEDDLLPGASRTCTGYPRQVTGTLVKGQDDYQPAEPYRSAVAGLHVGCVDGPEGADFDLYLEKWTGLKWLTVVPGDRVTSDEMVSHQGTPGSYRYRITATVGSGPYVLGFTAP